MISGAGFGAFLLLWTLLVAMITRSCVVAEVAEYLRGDLPEWVVLNYRRWRR